MEKLQLPFNVTVMSEDDKQKFVDKINSGEVQLELEVRDDEKRLIGFQTMLSLDVQNKLLQNKLKAYANLVDELHKAEKRKEKKKILLEIKKAQLDYTNLLKSRSLFIVDKDDIDYLESLDSYKEDDIILSNQIEEIKYSRI